MAQQVEYYIDNVLMSYNPGVPDPTKVMILDAEACIGYADIVDRTGCSFKIYTDITTTEEDLADFEEFQLCAFGVEHNGEQVVSNGIPVINSKG